MTLARRMSSVKFAGCQSRHLILQVRAKDTVFSGKRQDSGVMSAVRMDKMRTCSQEHECGLKS